MSCCVGFVSKFTTAPLSKRTLYCFFFTVCLTSWGFVTGERADCGSCPFFILSTAEVIPQANDEGSVTIFYSNEIVYPIPVLVFPTGGAVTVDGGVLFVAGCVFTPER